MYKYILDSRFYELKQQCTLVSVNTETKMALEFRQKSETKFTLTIISTEIKAKLLKAKTQKKITCRSIALERQACESEWLSAPLRSSCSNFKRNTLARKFMRCLDILLNSENPSKQTYLTVRKLFSLLQCTVRMVIYKANGWWRWQMSYARSIQAPKQSYTGRSRNISSFFFFGKLKRWSKRTKQNTA